MKRWRLSWLVGLGLAMGALGAPALSYAETKTATAEQVTETDRAMHEVSTQEKALADLQRNAVALKGKFDDQKAAIDRLKQKKRTWRYNDELNAAQADANDTAKKLEDNAKAIKSAQGRLTDARRALVRAIDGELASGAPAARDKALRDARARVAPQVAAPPKRIVIPNSDIDETADPEELEQQARALAETEKELERQKNGLKQQEDELTAVAKARREHDRANEVSQRDDDQPHRSTTSGGHSATGGHSGGDASDAPASGQLSGGSNPAPSGGSDRGGFEADATIVLADVIDASTIDTLKKAQGSNDPAQRAAAAKKAREAVADRQKQLKAKREAIEARAKKLRSGQ